MHSKLKIKFLWCMLSALNFVNFAHCHKSNSVDLKNVNSACVKSMSCIQKVANQVFDGLSEHKAVDFGIFAIEPVETKKSETTGRSSSLMSFLKGNSVKIPVGPVFLTIQKSDEYDNYYEFAVLKKVEGRGNDRKQMKFFVPAFLVMSQVGWWLLAIAGVKLLSIKAFLVSKVALIIAAIMTIKRLFEHVHTIPPHYYEHPEPLMMPYNFDFGAFPHHEFNVGDLHASLPLNSLGGHEHTAALHGAVGAETAVNNVVHNNTQATAASTNSQSQASGLGSFATVGNDIKRQDYYSGDVFSQLFRNYYNH